MGVMITRIYDFAAFLSYLAKNACVITLAVLSSLPARLNRPWLDAGSNVFKLLYCTNVMHTSSTKGLTGVLKRV